MAERNRALAARDRRHRLDRSSFYFIHLDLSLKAREPARRRQGRRLAGARRRLLPDDQILVAPAKMPDELTWFKWEAYTTWLSGFALLVVVYYLNAELFLIDKSVLDMTRGAGRRSLQFLSLAAAWIAYEALCRSPLGKHEIAAGARRLRLPRRAHLCLHPCVQRPRRLHADRRADRHHHGGERFRH